ncbi:hypothetical protein VA7868_02397 [Vibrio aerogenes CECT 7868]|uniref:Phospholipase C/D domain-containing protein n=1 Tax=Vibrio aerogenes CECT 7868 TaxID=1216006 RepID=A0A1M5Z7I6_9VIBR|nr:zinc dependent phospholipase C family protein [Vibrio aerogenes]SHI20144.1 hypothetical protein VA7868_02397 [Vibrio aerogenes CECT 7868]
MPGAFAHIVAVNQAFSDKNLKTFFPSRIRRMLTVYQRYTELGAVSPDFPYLQISDTQQAEWANRMHYQQVGVLLLRMIEQVRQMEGEPQERAFAWLSGFLAHVITDITIHPVIELKVGHYTQNKLRHRQCEMHQDAFIWQRMGMGHIGSVERMSRHLLHCADVSSSRQLDQSIKRIWLSSLQSVFGEEEVTPDIDGWFNGFVRVIGLVEDQYRLFPFSRHVAAFLGLVYPDTDKIDSGYIQQLPTPSGYQHYDQVFDFAVNHILEYQSLLSEAVFHHGRVDWLKNWNLDTGHCEEGMLTVWGKSSERVA